MVERRYSFGYDFSCRRFAEATSIELICRGVGLADIDVFEKSVTNALLLPKITQLEHSAHRNL